MLKWVVLFFTLVTALCGLVWFEYDVKGALRSLHTPNADCSGLADQDKCDKNSECTWCKSAAVPSKCYQKSDAGKLPPGVFKCDSELQDACESLADQDKCDASSECTWCKSAAVPSKCYKKSDAKKLPSGVFKCDETKLEIKLK